MDRLIALEVFYVNALYTVYVLFLAFYRPSLFLLLARYVPNVAKRST